MAPYRTGKLRPIRYNSETKGVETPQRKMRDFPLISFGPKAAVRDCASRFDTKCRGYIDRRLHPRRAHIGSRVAEKRGIRNACSDFQRWDVPQLLLQTESLLLLFRQTAVVQQIAHYWPPIQNLSCTQ